MSHDIKTLECDLDVIAADYRLALQEIETAASTIDEIVRDALLAGIEESDERIAALRDVANAIAKHGTELASSTMRRKQNTIKLMIAKITLEAA